MHSGICSWFIFLPRYLIFFKDISTLKQRLVSFKAHPHPRKGCQQLSFILQRELSDSFQNLHWHQTLSKCSPDQGLQVSKSSVTKFLLYLPFPPAACLERWSVFLTVKDVENVLKFSERNLKENIFVLARSTVARMTSICCRLK